MTESDDLDQRFAAALNSELCRIFPILNRAPRLKRSELDISDQVEIDPDTGQYRLKELKRNSTMT